MKAMERLNLEIRKRPNDLISMKQDGAKIVGYTPGGFMPEELVCATGGVPLGLIRGGDAEPVSESLRYVSRFFDTFCRAQIGYKMMNEELLYQAPGLLVNPVTDQNFKMVGEVWRFLTGEEVAYMGVPKIKDDLGIHTFQICLNVLKEKLEAFTGNKITEKGLNGAIELYNKMRGLLKAIGDMRKSDKFIISSRDFVRLNHASYILDPSVMVEILESLYEELKTAASVTRSDKRILFVGSTLAMGDNQIFDILDDLTGDIVFEEFAEGIRPYMYNVALNGDPMAALTDALYVKRLPPAYFRPFEEFQSRMLGLVSEHRANGILWYQMMMRDSYDMQYYLFEAKVLKDLNIPIIKIESEYDTNEKGQLKTRLETFVSIMK